MLYESLIRWEDCGEHAQPDSKTDSLYRAARAATPETLAGMAGGEVYPGPYPSFSRRACGFSASACLPPVSTRARARRRSSSSPAWQGAERLPGCFLAEWPGHSSLRDFLLSPRGRPAVALARVSAWSGVARRQAVLWRGRRLLPDIQYALSVGAARRDEDRRAPSAWPGPLPGPSAHGPLRLWGHHFL